MIWPCLLRRLKYSCFRFLLSAETGPSGRTLIDTPKDYHAIVASGWYGSNGQAVAEFRLNINVKLNLPWSLSTHFLVVQLILCCILLKWVITFVIFNNRSYPEILGFTTSILKYCPSKRNFSQQKIRHLRSYRVYISPTK